MTSKSSFGIIGLGVMGKSLALNILDKGHLLSVYNRTAVGEEKVVTDFINKNNSFNNLQGFTELHSFVSSLQQPRKILLMVPSGVVDHVLNDLQAILQEDDIIIDGGNSHYKDTLIRVKEQKSKGIRFIGMGVSGGEEGALKGPSLMPGGDKTAYLEVNELLESIAARNDKRESCVTYIGEEGAGHFVKMIHNGIEYAEMQLLAEVFHLLKNQMNYQEISELLKSWNATDLSSYLLGITSHILLIKEGEDYLLDKILDQAGNKGTGSWSSIVALENGMPNTMMTASVFARYTSSFKNARISLSRKRNTSNKNSQKIDVEQLKNVYRVARIINHHQGFELIKTVSDRYDWGINLSELARIWTGGCIIKSTLMEEIMILFEKDSSILKNSQMLSVILNTEDELSDTITLAIKNRISLPAFMSVYSYWIAMSEEQSSANLIQAQRDYFGAHTYNRTDDDSNASHHTNWKDA